MRTVLALGLLAGLAACSPPKQLFVDGAWVRLGAVAGAPAAAYFIVHGGPADATLINVTTDIAIRSEMHDTMKGGNMTSMKPLASIAIPANTNVEFKPGGRHVMLFSVNSGIKPGGRITFTYSFADGTRILYNSGVVAAGDPEPK